MYAVIMTLGNNLGESIMVDILGASKGNLNATIDSLLQITEEQGKVEEEQKAELLRLSKIRYNVNFTYLMQ